MPSVQKTINNVIESWPMTKHPSRFFSQEFRKVFFFAAMSIGTFLCESPIRPSSVLKKENVYVNDHSKKSFSESQIQILPVILNALIYSIGYLFITYFPRNQLCTASISKPIEVWSTGIDLTNDVLINIPSGCDSYLFKVMHNLKIFAQLSCGCY